MDKSGPVAPLVKPATLLLLIFLALGLCRAPTAKSADSYDYQNFVHMFTNSSSYGNWTYIEKPVFPLLINQSQLQVGENLTVVCPLVADHSYHAYCYGSWINNGSEPKTDYDIRVYDCSGELVGYHTEAAGLPEHLGDTVNEPFFTPAKSGNYSFVIDNDLRESKNAEEATFMLIEDVKCDVWNQHYVAGKDNASLPVLETSWAYEFVTESQRIEIWIKVPETLDMYEARLYLMSDEKLANATAVNNITLPWEPGLYGSRQGVYGGYNLDSKDYRGLAYASCEYYGQNMFINYTSPHPGKSLYHLVLIGETGSGDIDFLIKTDFKNACLKDVIVPQKAYPDSETSVQYISNCTDLENATLSYSTNAWINQTSIQMDIIDNRTCQAVVPGQPAGMQVNYEIRAFDTVENTLTTKGQYSVKNPVTLNLTLEHESVSLGDNITVTGNMSPSAEEIEIIITITSTNETKQIKTYTNSEGAFAASYKPEALGVYYVQAKFEGDQTRFKSETSQIEAEVNEPSLLTKYSLYICGGTCGTIAAGIIIYLRKSKE